MIHKQTILFIGPNPNSLHNAIGGTVTFFKLLFSTSFCNQFNFIFVDTTKPNLASKYQRIISNFQEVLMMAYTMVFKRYDKVVLIQGGGLFFIRFLCLYFINLIFKRKKIIIAIRGHVEEAPLWHLKCFTFRKADLIWVQTRDASEWICNMFHVPMDKITVIPNGINFKDYPTHWPAPSQNNEIVFLFVGWLKKEKGVFELLNAFDVIHQLYKNTRLVFLGRGAGELELKAKCEQLGLSKNVVFKGWVDQGKTHIIQGGHCVVLPTYREGFPNTILEGMALGRPIISSTIGCIESILKPAGSLLATPRDVNSLVDCMKTIIEDPGLIEDMGKFNFNYARENFDIEHISRTIIEKISVMR